MFTSYVRNTELNTEEWFDADGFYHYDEACSKPAFIKHSDDPSKPDEVHFCYHGEFHRDDDLPAEITKTCKRWYQNGELHRETGPASVETGPDGYIIAEWYQKDTLHRIDGPAQIEMYGPNASTIDFRWYRNGQLHNERYREIQCMPAYVSIKTCFIPTTILKYFTDHRNLDNTQLDPLQRVFKNDADVLKWMSKGELHRTDGPAVVYSNGTEEWYKDGKRHRQNEPAITKTNGYKAWYINGERHRSGGPAIITETGTEVWYNCGEKHRMDGPAFTTKDGCLEWYTLGSCKNRGDLPNMIYPDGTWTWCKTYEGEPDSLGDDQGMESEEHPGRYHLLSREDGPAQIEGDKKVWYRHGKRHRADGPAVIDPDVGPQYYIEGNFILPDDPKYLEAEHEAYKKRQLCDKALNTSWRMH